MALLFSELSVYVLVSFLPGDSVFLFGVCVIKLAKSVELVTPCPTISWSWWPTGAGQGERSACVSTARGTMSAMNLKTTVKLTGNRSAFYYHHMWAIPNNARGTAVPHPSWWGTAGPFIQLLVFNSANCPRTEGSSRAEETATLSHISWTQESLGFWFPSYKLRATPHCSWHSGFPWSCGGESPWGAWESALLTQ